MAEYLIQDSTLTSIGNEIRTMKGSSSKMTPATMTSNLKSANTEVNNQTTIMNQILAALETKGDGGLSFKVVGGTSQPSNPTENTIWVNTSTTITSWEFSATQPIASSGKVWICIGMSSNVEFNILNNNVVKTYPRYAKQYISGTWVNKTAKTRKNNQWVDWAPEGSLYYLGDECLHVTGGWKQTQWLNSALGTVTKNSDNIFLETTNANSNAFVVTENKIDLSKYNTLKINVLTQVSNSSNNQTDIFIVTTNNNPNDSHKIIRSTFSGTGIKTVDISALPDSYYVALSAGGWNSGTCQLKFNKVWLE